MGFNKLFFALNLESDEVIDFYSSWRKRKQTKLNAMQRTELLPTESKITLAMCKWHLLRKCPLRTPPKCQH